MKPIRCIASKTSRKSSLILVAAVSATLVSTASAQTTQWNNNGTDWNTGLRWASGVPNSTTGALFITATSIQQPNLSLNGSALFLQFSNTAGDFNISSSSPSTKLSLFRAGSTGAVATATNAIASFKNSGTVTISAPLVLSAGAGTTQTFGQNAGGTTAISGVISELGANTSLRYVGSGTTAVGFFNISGANTYTGATIIGNGTQHSTVNISNDNALGTTAGGTTVNNLSTLSFSGGITVGGAETLSLNGLGSLSSGGALRNISGNNTYQGTATLAGTTRINSDSGSLTFNTAANSITGTNQNLTLGGGGNGTIAGTITTGSGTLTKDGAGTWTLGGANTYTGTTSINAGALQAVNGIGLNTSSILQLRGGVFQSSGTFSRNLSTASGGVNFTSFAVNPVGGGFAANGGVLNLQLNNGTSALTWGSTNSFVSTGQTLIFGSATADNLVDFQNALNLGTSGTNTRTITVNDNASSSSDIARISGAIAGNANQTLEKAGAGTLQLTNTNTYSGQTTISAGTLQIGNGGTTGSIANTSSVTNNAALIYNRSNAMTVGYAINGTGTVTKEGGDTLTLTAANGYAGTTTVNAGTLLINGSTSSTSLFTVNNTATLGGTGSIGGGVTVKDGATLAPGASIESLASGALTMESGSTFAYEVADNTSTGADLLGVNGGVSLTNVTLGFDLATQNALAGSGWNPDDKLTLISYFDAGSGITSGFTDGVDAYMDDTAYLFGTNSWRFDYNDTVAGGNFGSNAIADGQNRFVTMTLVPEPSSAALLGALGMIAMLRRRR